MEQSSKIFSSKSLFAGDEDLMDRQAEVYNTKTYNDDLNSLLEEVKYLANLNQDHLHLWDSNLNKTICRKWVYFPKFVALCSKQYSPS